VSWDVLVDARGGGDDARWVGCCDVSMFPGRFSSDYCQFVGGVLCRPM
jgi:hypothetical protein